MDVRVGNVHSGATPPWLRGDDDDKGTSGSGGGGLAGTSSGTTFGPSLDEFIKHSELSITKIVKHKNC